MKIKTITAIIAIIFMSNISAMAQKTIAKATKGKFLFGVAVNMQQVNGNNPIESELIAREFNSAGRQIQLGRCRQICGIWRKKQTGRNRALPYVAFPDREVVLCR